MVFGLGPCTTPDKGGREIYVPIIGRNVLVYVSTVHRIVGFITEVVLDALVALCWC